MSLSSAKAKLDAQGGDPVTGYISKTDHQESYDELLDDTALTGATTAEAITVSGAAVAATINGRDPDDLAAGPASATDNALVRFDGTDGKTIQNSGITVDDSGNISSNTTISKSGAAFLSVKSTDNATYIDLNPATVASRQYRFLTNNALRWILSVDNAAESGSDAGSNFSLNRYSDAQASLGAALTINRATGKVTLGSVGATAGLELGASGPRVMSGTGSPEGAVTAPVGSQWIDTAATTGAIKWIKAAGSGSSGWVVEYGDTGWRNVTAASLSSGWAWGTFGRIRRVGNVVELGLALNGASASGSYPYTLASGFRTKGDTYLPLFSTVGNFTGAPYGKVYSDGSVQIVSYSTATYVLQATYTTTDAWPSSLPGSAA